MKEGWTEAGAGVGVAKGICWKCKLIVLESGKDQVQPLQYVPDGVKGPKIEVSVAFSLPTQKVISLPSSDILGPTSRPLNLPVRLLAILVDPITWLSILASRI